MDRGAWWATVDGVAKELDMTVIIQHTHTYIYIYIYIYIYVCIYISHSLGIYSKFCREGTISLKFYDLLCNYTHKFLKLL